MKKNGLTLNLFLMIVMTDIGESIAQLFMKKGLLHTGIDSITLANLPEFVAASASSLLIWLGVAVYLVNFFLWIFILTRIDLSVAFPVGSTSYIFIPVLAMFFLNEQITPLRWSGIILIVAGIHFVSQSGRTKKEPEKI